jgi:pentatricopeptide repeat protein
MNTRCATRLDARSSMKMLTSLRNSSVDESLVEYLNLRHSGLCLPLSLYNTILEKCEDRADAAAFVLKDMQLRKLLPDEVSYLPLLRGAAKRGDFASGLSLLDEMTRGGLLLRRRSFTPLLKAASSAGNTEVVIKTWLRLRRDQIQPRAEDCLDLLWALLKNNRVMGARQVLNPPPI